jgi:hypothetical protein
MATGYPLERYWPSEIGNRESWEEVDTFVASYRTGSFVSAFNAFIIDRSSHFDRINPYKPYIMIPLHYKNSTRLINAKISYLQQCAKTLSSASSKGSEEGKKNVLLARESILKLLSLTTSVREEFFGDIREKFYRGSAVSGRRQKPDQPFPGTYRCRAVDIWVYCELKVGYHDPVHVNGALPGFDWHAGPSLQDSGEYSHH